MICDRLEAEIYIIFFREKKTVFCIPCCCLTDHFVPEGLGKEKICLNNEMTEIFSEKETGVRRRQPVVHDDAMRHRE